jgi:hypothetical protein
MGEPTLEEKFAMLDELGDEWLVMGRDTVRCQLEWADDWAGAEVLWIVWGIGDSITEAVDGCLEQWRSGQLNGIPADGKERSENEFRALVRAWNERRRELGLEP